jgi:hypothetical protein
MWHKYPEEWTYCNGYDPVAGNSSLNTVQHATIEEAVFSVDLTDTPIDWLDSDQVLCVYCRSTRSVSCKFRANWN